MEIKGKIHCFFEQSGTFKKEFKNIDTLREYLENIDNVKPDNRQ